MAPLGERIKLVDFGIAKFLDGPVRKTTVGMILGTPLYMSPEQCQGAEDLDAKVDVYAMGVMLFEMVTGHLPYIAQTAAALMRQHMFAEPPRLRKELKKEIPESLDLLVYRMLAKVPAQRPSMEEVAAVLEALQPQVAKRSTGLQSPVLLKSRTSRSPILAGPGEPALDPFAATIGGAPAPPGAAHGHGTEATLAESLPPTASGKLDPFASTMNGTGGIQPLVATGQNGTQQFLKRLTEHRAWTALLLLLVVTLVALLFVHLGRGRVAPPSSQQTTAPQTAKPPATSPVAQTPPTATASSPAADNAVTPPAPTTKPSKAGPGKKSGKRRKSKSDKKWD